MIDPEKENLRFIIDACSRLGIAREFALRRLRYDTFCFLDQKVMYVGLPKAACTTVKHILLELFNKTIDFNSIKPLAPESTMDMLIHERRHFPCPTLLELQPLEMSKAIGHVDGWLTFTVIRNPFSRLVSFFNDKIRKGEPKYSQWHNKYINSFSDEAAILGFRQFVADLRLENISPGGNSHLVRQVDLILFGLIRYSHIIHAENINDMLDILRGRAVKPCSRMRHLNASDFYIDGSFYDQRTADKVAVLYEEDFETFGYDRDWTRIQRHLEPDTVRCEAFLRQIYERNRMIEHLHKKLFAAD